MTRTIALVCLGLLPGCATARYVVAVDPGGCAAERVALARWMTRLRRAFNAVEKHQSRIGRLERRLSQPG